MRPVDEPTTSAAALRRVVELVAPGGRVVGVNALAGSFSNHSWHVDVEAVDRSRRQIVIRRYADHGEDPRRKAEREFFALTMLREHPEVPAPEPLLLDADGSVLGSPGIVTELVRGDFVPLESAPRPWNRRCRAAAGVLARIHDIVIDPPRPRSLMDAAAEAVWFVSADVPDFMLRHPDGMTVWRAVRDLRPHLAAVEPTLVHLDFWSGNLLWAGDRVSAVVDWEEAGYGDPAIDVAYGVMELVLEGLDDDAADFVRTYLRASGRALPNLAYWKLAAAARPMTDLDGWLTRPGMRDRFRRFIGDALREAG